MNFVLRSLKIHHFKSIYQAELTFGNANLFIGPNGAGKSNILEALGILAAAVSKGIEPARLDERGIRLSLPTLFKSAFAKTSLPQQFRLEAQFDGGRYDCSIRAGLKKTSLEFHSESLFQGNEKVFGRGPNGINVNTHLVSKVRLDPKLVEPTRGLWEVISPFAKISDEFRQEIDDLKDFSIYAPQTAVMRGVAVDSRIKEPLGLTGSGLATAFAQVAFDKKKSPAERKRVDNILSLIWRTGWADQIKIANFDPKIVPSHIKSDGSLLYIRDRFMTKYRNYLSTFDASEGTLYLIFVATLLASSDAPRVFALDNVDGTLNPRLVKILTDTIVSVCCGPERAAVPMPNLVTPDRLQTFVTSHHPSSLDSFDLYDESQAVFVAHRALESERAKGSTTFQRMKAPHGLSKEDWLIRSEGKNLSTLLLEGLLPDAL